MSQRELYYKFNDDEDVDEFKEKGSASECCHDIDVMIEEKGMRTPKNCSSLVFVLTVNQLLLRVLSCRFSSIVIDLSCSSSPISRIFDAMYTALSETDKDVHENESALVSLISPFVVGVTLYIEALLDEVDDSKVYERIATYVETTTEKHLNILRSVTETLPKNEGLVLSLYSGLFSMIWSIEVVKRCRTRTDLLTLIFSKIEEQQSAVRNCP